MKAKHRMSFRVSFSDVDMAGIVYTGRYSDFMLKAWEAYFAEIGIPWESFFDRKDFGGLPVIKMGLEFKSPAWCGDWVTVETFVSKLTQRRIYFKFNLLHKITKRQIAVGTITATAFSKQLRPIPIPSFIMEAIIPSK